MTKKIIIKDLEKCKTCGADLPLKFLDNGLKDRRILLEDCDYCKSIKANTTEAPDIEEMNQIMQDWHNAFLTQFEGVPVKIDPNLEGGQYYIAVSQQTYRRLEKIKDGQEYSG